MKKLITALVLFVPVVAFAQQPTEAPGLRYFAGPSQGEVWQRAGALSGGLRSVTGTTDTILCSDNGKTIFYNNASAIAVTLPQANSVTLGCFGPNWQVMVFNIGAGTVTVTPTTSTTNGSSSKAFTTGLGGRFQSDGTNYWQN